MNINDLAIPIRTPKSGYVSTGYTILSTLPCIYHFLTQRVLILFLVVLSVLHKLVNRN